MYSDIVPSFEEQAQPSSEAPVTNIPALPDDLTQREQWVLWRYESPNGRVSKVPHQVTGRRAKTDDPKTWNTFPVVGRAWLEAPGRFDGMGFVFAESDPFVGGSAQRRP